MAPIVLSMAAVLAGCTRAAAPRASMAAPACIAGYYDGSQMELAAALELADSGQFRFALSYGALDEEAQGRWRYADGAVHLTSQARAAGMAEFADTSLRYEAGALLVERHGRLLRFRRVGGKCGPGK